MRKIEEKKIEHTEINYEQGAAELAEALLGKTLSYNGIAYMITVTEAYPYDGASSYVKAYGYESESKGRKALVGKDKIGDCFIYGGMLHVACGGGHDVEEKKRSGVTVYKCGNVLIRGGIRIKGDKLEEEDRELNYKDGKPYTLCRNKFKIPPDYPVSKLTCDGNKIKIKANGFEFCTMLKTVRKGLKLADKDELLQFRLKKEEIQKYLK